MSRVFRRGELRASLLHVLAATGPAHGYTLMQHLAEHVGHGWRPSPGAIYPALLALEDTGLIEGHDDGDGTRTYHLTSSGAGACADRPDLLADLAGRQPADDGHPSLGDLLDAFTRNTPRPSTRLDLAQAAAVSDTLDLAQRRIADILDQGSNQ